MSEPYVSLHNHFVSSPMDGMLKYDQAAEFAAQHSMPGLAITDHGTMAGIPAFVKACKKRGVKPIIGMEAYVVPDHKKHEYFKGPSGREVRSGYHLTLLAKNLVGYHNLIRLNNIAFLDGYYGWPKIDMRDLEAHRDGLMVLSGCPSSELCRLILAGKQTEATQFYGRLSELFKHDLGLEVMVNSMRDDMQRKANIGLLQLAAKFQAMIVPTNDAHYLKAEHRTFHDEMFKLNQWDEDPVEGKKKEKEKDDGKEKKKAPSNWRKGYDGLYHLKTPDEMAAAFPPGEFGGDIVSNTLRVAERIEDYDIFDQTSKLPRQIANPEQILTLMARAGLTQRGLDGRPEYQARLDRELGTIWRLGFASYFLTTREIVEIIRSLNCPVGWGRGSGGSSLINYCLGITDVDPIKYKLLFERFISEDRPEWPDIDLDVPETRRSEILGKLLTRYGKDRISYISVAHTFRPKMIIRDLCRTFGIQQDNPKKAAHWSGLVPFEYEDYEKSIKGTDLEKEMEKDQQGKFILDAFRELVGVQRHVGTHASGLVISSESIAEHLPVRQETVELGGQDVQMMVSQYTMDWLDKFGFVKFDVLGLTKLDIVYGAAAEAGVDLKQIPIDDPETFKLIGEGHVEGMFQLDKSVVCVELCRQIKPRNMEDLATILAINRPGVLGSGQYEIYLNRRKGQEEVRYAHPDLREALGSTYGVCIFQEDLMRMAQVCAGYTAVEAYNLMKGIGKKDMEIVRPHLIKFAERTQALGKVKADDITQLVAQLEAAGRYAFNRAHATEYAHLTYACAYLSCHHPLLFYKWLISMAGDEEERVKYVSAALGRGIKVLSPHVNLSAPGFTVEGDALRVGLQSVRGVGEVIAQKIVASRPYRDAAHAAQSIRRDTYSALHAVGALAGLAGLDQHPPAVKLEEIAVLGMSLQGAEKYRDAVRRSGAVSFHEVKESSSVIMVISKIKPHIDKKKRKMAFLTMLDVHGPRAEGTMFADAYEQNPPKEDVLYCATIARTPRGFLVNQIEEIEKLKQMWDMQDKAGVKRRGV